MVLKLLLSNSSSQTSITPKECALFVTSTQRLLISILKKKSFTDICCYGVSVFSELSAMDDPALSRHMAHVDVLAFLSSMLRDGLAQIHSKAALQTGSQADACEVKEGERGCMQGMECNRVVDETGCKEKKKKKKKESRGNEQEVALARSGGVVKGGERAVTTPSAVLDVLTHGLHLLGNIWYVELILRSK